MVIPSKLSRWLVRLIPILVLIGTASELSARLGGGGGYSGGGGGGYSGGGGGGYSGGGGGYSGGGGGSYPPITVKEFLTGMLCMSPLGVFMLYSCRNTTQAPTVIGRASREAVDWDVIAEADPDFSPVLFRDFVYTLFSKIHEARGDKGLARFGQFIVEDALKDLRELNPHATDVQGVIVGALQIHRVDVVGDNTRVTLAFKANYTESWGGAPPAAVYSHQIWVLQRAGTAKSRPPEAITVFDCLACGSSFEPAPTGVCSHCGELVKPGMRHWSLTAVTERERRSVGPALTHSVPDVGLNLPTRYAPDYQEDLAWFEREHPEFKFEAMTNRFKHIFYELQEAWSEQDLERLRPFETDSLFQNHSYWVREYQKQGLRNELGQVRIRKLEVVKIRSDRFYDAMTCRIFASMTDCTRWANGSIACGNPSVPKQFSEYWTFIRGRGVSENNYVNSVCPSCGAELKITMAGICGYCDSKLTSGQFDWVLSEIQQDEEYHG